MRWQEVPVVGGAYSDDSKPWSAQDTVNWIPEVAERPGGRSPVMLRSAPGLLSFSLPEAAPVRGLHNVEGRLLAVVGRTLYRIGTNGVPVSIGTIPGVGRVSIAHNQVTGGNEAVIVNGQNGYIYRTADDTLTQITDEGFPGAKVVDFVDGYIVGVEPFGRYWFHSDLAAAAEYNTLDRSEAEAQPDRIVTLIVTHRDVLVFGERSAEFFYNTGEATGTFQRRDGTEMEVGCAATHSVARVDNSVCWLGHDGCFYRLNGYQPVRISTHAIEQAISRSTWKDCFAVVYEDRGHKIVYWTFPDGQTWGYDVATQEWHRRQSKGMDRWRVNALVRWNRQWIAGDYRNGTVYQLSWDAAHEAGDEIERRRVSGVLHDQQNRVVVNAVELVMDVKPGLGNPVPAVPVPPEEPGPLVLWANGSGIVQKTDGTVLSFSTALAAPRGEVRAHRSSGRVYVTDDGGLKVYQSGASDALIGTPATYNFPTNSTLKYNCDVDPVTGAYFVSDARTGGSLHILKPDDTLVSVTSLAVPKLTRAMGDGRVAVWTQDGGEIRIYGPNDNYAAPLHTVTDQWGLVGLWWDAATQTLFWALDSDLASGNIMRWNAGVVTTVSAGFYGYFMWHAPALSAAIMHKASENDRLYVRNLDGTSGPTMIYGSALSDVVHTSPTDAAVVGNVVAVLQKHRRPDNSTYNALHLCSAATGSVLHTHSFDSGASDEISVTGNDRDGEFYVGSGNFSDIVAIKAAAPFTTRTIPTHTTDARYVEWL